MITEKQWWTACAVAEQVFFGWFFRDAKQQEMSYGMTLNMLAVDLPTHFGPKFVWDFRSKNYESVS